MKFISLKNLRALSHRRFTIPHADRLEEVIRSFSYSEKLIFWLLFGVLTVSTLVLFSRVNDSILVEIEAKGGSFTEGIVGSPRFINPVLALSDADHDVVSLVYSGLLKAKPGGGVIEDLAESYTISDNGLVYDFTLRKNVVFHDGTPVTTEDVVFTIDKALDPTLKSLERANWDGVRVESIDERHIRFTLTRPYAPFLQNATMGILPKHIWENVSSDQFPFSDLNISPIGSGPYTVSKVTKDSSGIPQTYVLKAFKDYALQEPYIEKITLAFYQNEATLISTFNKGGVDSISGISAEQIKKLNTEHVERSALPRIFAVFFNQNNAHIFSNIEVRKALDLAVDKQEIVNRVLAGFGTPINSPIPPESITSSDRAALSYSGPNLEEAKNILPRGGWKFDEAAGIWKSEKKGELRFSLATSNVPELKAVAEILKESWSTLGVHVDIEVFEAGNLNQNVIRPREYDALLFGEVIGRELDFFAFWHSSQRNDPGLNIALYANITADKLLEEGRATADRSVRDQKYVAFEKEVLKDTPAVFLYSPDFIYILPKNIQGVDLDAITTSADRFLNIHQWYIRTDKVWSIFSR